MTFDNIDLYSQIIGSIIKDPVVLSSIPSPIVMDDFAQEGGSPARVIFFAISNLIDRGVVKLDITVIETYLQDYLSLNQTYNRNHGREFLYMAMDKGEPENFSAYYSQLKKNSLLRDLKEHGYDISPYDVEACEPNTKEEMDCITRYEEATEDDILSYVERSLSVIRSRHSATQGSFITAADGLREYLEELERAPEIGPPLCGLAYNSIVRGALRGKLHLRSAPSNTGKAIPNYTKIPLYDGTWKRVDEIRVGDKLIGSNGLPTTVMKVHPQPAQKEIYEVTFLDGHTAECCEDHLWSYYYKSHRCYKIRTETTKDIMKRDLKQGRSFCFSVPLVSEVKYTTKNLPIPPYVMGLILGDGSFRYDSSNKSFYFSSKTEELPKKIAEIMGYEVVKNSDYNYSYSFIHTNEEIKHKKVWVEDILSAYPELWNLKSHEKFIPEEYLCGDTEQRWALLRGLLDTDGSISNKIANIRYTTSSPRLKEQVEQLARSLGMAVSTHIDSREKYTAGVCYDLTLWCPTEKLNKMFSLSNKLELAEKHMNRTRMRRMDRISITNIRPTGRYTEMTCFTVDAPDALFCMDNYTLTHNTRLSVFDACNIVFPVHWWPGGRDENGEMHPAGFVYENNKVPQKVLFITTEMKEKEIQSIILSYVSGVENSKILYNGCNESEKERIKDAIQIIEKYKDYFYLERIQDPNLTNVQSTIKKHILLHDVGYVFYDYIFSSPSLISQFVGNGIREDVALMMLSNQLKEIAATYNVFISTSTQVNGDGLNPEEKRDQRVLRGSKAIADKVDVAMIVEKLEPEAMEKVQSYISQVRRAPTHLTTIYKIRSGTRKGIRIYSYINLGNGERQDLFLTDENNKLVILEDYEKIAAFPLVSLPIINDTVLNNLSN